MMLQGTRARFRESWNGNEIPQLLILDYSRIVNVKKLKCLLVKPQLRVGIEITHYFQEIDLERHLFLDFPRIYPGSF